MDDETLTSLRYCFQVSGQLYYCFGPSKQSPNIPPDCSGLGGRRPALEESSRSRSRTGTSTTSRSSRQRVHKVPCSCSYLTPHGLCCIFHGCCSLVHSTCYFIAEHPRADHRRRGSAGKFRDRPRAHQVSCLLSRLFKADCFITPEGGRGNLGELLYREGLRDNSRRLRGISIV